MDGAVRNVLVGRPYAPEITRAGSNLLPARFCIKKTARLARSARETGLWRAGGRRPHTKEEETSQHGAQRLWSRLLLPPVRPERNAAYAAQILSGFSYGSVCCFIDCSKEAMRVGSADHDVREIRREDGVTIRLHFSPGGATLQECMVRILEKHIENSMKS